jgi:hypothetical protein
MPDPSASPIGRDLQSRHQKPRPPGALHLASEMWACSVLAQLGRVRATEPQFGRNHARPFPPPDRPLRLNLHHSFHSRRVMRKLLHAQSSGAATNPSTTGKRISKAARSGRARTWLIGLSSPGGVSVVLPLNGITLKDIRKRRHTLRRTSRSVGLADSPSTVVLAQPPVRTVAGYRTRECRGYCSCRTTGMGASSPGLRTSRDQIISNVAFVF